MSQQLKWASTTMPSVKERMYEYEINAIPITMTKLHNEKSEKEKDTVLPHC
jgi:hypothetical protein